MFVIVFFPQISMSAHRAQAFFVLSAAWMFLAVTSVLVPSRDIPWQQMEEPVEVMRTLETKRIISWSFNPQNDISHHDYSVKSKFYYISHCQKASIWQSFQILVSAMSALCCVRKCAAATQLSVWAHCLNEFPREPTLSFRLMTTCTMCTLVQRWVSWFAEVPDVGVCGSVMSCGFLPQKMGRANVGAVTGTCTSYLPPELQYVGVSKSECEMCPPHTHTPFLHNHTSVCWVSGVFHLVRSCLVLK